MHHHQHHRLVINTLKAIAKEENKSLSAIKKRFAFQADPQVTQLFWDILFRKYPDLKYREVFHCPGCNKFELE